MHGGLNPINRISISVEKRLISFIAEMTGCVAVNEMIVEQDVRSNIEHGKWKYSYCAAMVNDQTYLSK